MLTKDETSLAEDILPTVMSMITELEDNGELEEEIIVQIETLTALASALQSSTEEDLLEEQLAEPFDVGELPRGKRVSGAEWLRKLERVELRDKQADAQMTAANMAIAAAERDYKTRLRDTIDGN